MFANGDFQSNNKPTKGTTVRKLKRHVEGLIDQFGVLLREHTSDITKQVNDSESESTTIPVSLYISDAPGTQRVSVKLTLTKKEVFSKAVDIDTGQQSLPLKDEKVKKSSLKAKQKDNARKEKEKKELAAKADAPK